MILRVVVWTVLIPFLLTLGHPDCNIKKFEHHFGRLCKSYPAHKRSTPDLNQGIYRNELTPWNNYISQFQPEKRIYGGGGYGQQPVMQPVWGNNEGNRMSWNFPTREETDLEMLNLEDIFNPLRSGGSEGQLPVERWRRNKETFEVLDNFLRLECCAGGCPWPSAYFKLRVLHPMICFIS